MMIRKATLEDYAALCELIDQVDALHRDRLPGIYRKPDGPVRERDEIAAIIADERAGLFVAEAEGKLAGYIHAILRDTPDAAVLVPRRFAMIDSMAVGASQRRKGIGQALIAQVQCWAREQGAASLDLNVYEFNRDALLFYESLGFTTLRRWMSMPLEDEAA